MMTHYTLLQYAIPREYMLHFVQACNTNLEYFVSADDLLGEQENHSINSVHEIFDLTSSEFKTIAVRINPFKRMALFYKSKTNPILDAQWKMGPNYVDYTGCKSLTEFLDLYLSPENPNYSSQNSVNTAPFYVSADSNLAVSYLLDFDNFNVDVRTIPEFATIENVDYLAEGHAACEDYKALYTEADKLKVAEVFAVDIAAWNYTFE
jgi:hypothetical protein